MCLCVPLSQHKTDQFPFPLFPLSQESWRRVISTGVQIGIPMPCFTTALSFYDGYRHEILPANLIQVGTEISSCCYLNTALKVSMARCSNHSQYRLPNVFLLNLEFMSVKHLETAG